MKPRPNNILNIYKNATPDERYEIAFKAGEKSFKSGKGHRFNSKTGKIAAKLRWK